MEIIDTYPSIKHPRIPLNPFHEHVWRSWWLKKKERNREIRRDRNYNLRSADRKNDEWCFGKGERLTNRQADVDTFYTFTRVRTYRWSSFCYRSDEDKLDTAIVSRWPSLSSIFYPSLFFLSFHLVMKNFDLGRELERQKPDSSPSLTFFFRNLNVKKTFFSIFSFLFLSFFFMKLIAKFYSDEVSSKK